VCHPLFASSGLRFCKDDDVLRFAARNPHCRHALHLGGSRSVRWGHLMIPGELFVQDGEIELNDRRKTVTLAVSNTGDRPIQVGSHYHFFETNPALSFDPNKTRGMRLEIASGTG